MLEQNSRTDGLKIRQRVGYVAERPTLYDWMTVDELGWFTAGFYDAEFLPRFQQLAADFRLPPHNKLKTLSKGMKAKVALSLALALDPALLVLDEPTSGLDALVRREFLESMVDRAATGKTVFLSSHQIHEVERVADIVAILRDGRLLLVEPLETLKRQIQEVTVTLTNGKPEPPDLQGEILRKRMRARQWQLIVRNLDPQRLDVLRSDIGAGAVEVRTPNLEEIFVAYMQQGESTGPE